MRRSMLTSAVRRLQSFSSMSHMRPMATVITDTIAAGMVTHVHVRTMMRMMRMSGDEKEEKGKR
jgi:hypothetical protein